MDDCNGELLQRLDYPQTGSDSSMDDCNSLTLTKSEQAGPGSDSSMDDCNPTEPREPYELLTFRFLYGRL